MSPLIRSSLLAVSMVSSAFILSACSGSRPQTLGVNEGHLSPCPSSPNCVSSRTSNTDHAIAPISFKQAIPLADAMQALKQALLSLPRTEIINETPTYLYAEATTKIMRFVDDVEFLFEDKAMITEVHVRSASRLGYRDFGVNRERIELIRAKLIDMGIGRR